MFPTKLVYKTCLQIQNSQFIFKKSFPKFLPFMR